MKHSQIVLDYLRQGSIFGVEGALNETKSQYTVEVCSANAEVFKISLKQMTWLYE